MKNRFSFGLCYPVHMAMSSVIIQLQCFNLYDFRDHFPGRFFFVPTKIFNILINSQIEKFLQNKS